MAIKARSVCDPNCHANPKCGLSATIEDGRIIAVEAANYPVPGYEKRICLMGSARLEYQYHPDRLRIPLKRIGARGEGQWEEITWDEAVHMFVDMQKKISGKYGSRAVAFSQASGAFGLLTRGSPLRYAGLTDATALRPSGVDYGVAKGLEYMFGVNAASFFASGGHSLDDTSNSRLTILWGNNPAVTRSVDHVPLKTARKSGTTLICIDPVNSETAKLCDEWISLRPGSDGALAMSMVNEIIRNELYDRMFLINHTNMPFFVNLDNGRLLRESDISQDGADECMVWCSTAGSLVPLSRAKSPELGASCSVILAGGSDIRAESVFNLVRNLAREFQTAKAATITGVNAETIALLAVRYAEADPAAIRVGYGIDRWYNSDLTARAIATLACLCGYIGIPGGGISLVDGGQSVPVRGSHFYAPEGRLPNFLSMMEADEAVREGNPYPIKMECISLGNPFNQLKPNRARVLKEYISSLEFITVIDHFMTDTAKFADLVLPACTIFERKDIVVDKFIQLQQKIVEPAGEAKTDFEIFQAFAAAYGIGNYFDKSPEEYIDSMLQTDSPLLQGVDLKRLETEKVIYPWPMDEPFVGFRDRIFPTKSARIEVFKEDLVEYGAELPDYREPVEASPDNPLFNQYPLVLLSSHSRYRIHSTFANLEKVKRREPEPVVRIHHADARHRSIQDGDIVEVSNDRGRVIIKCSLDDAVREGCVIIGEGHWIDQFIEGDPYSLTHDHYSPTTENYAHYDVLVEVCQWQEADKDALLK